MRNGKKEKFIQIAGYKRIFNEVLFDRIIFTDFFKWNKNVLFFLSLSLFLVEKFTTWREAKYRRFLRRERVEMTHRTPWIGVYGIINKAMLQTLSWLSRKQPGGIHYRLTKSTSTSFSLFLNILKSSIKSKKEEQEKINSAKDLFVKNFYYFTILKLLFRQTERNIQFFDVKFTIWINNIFTHFSTLRNRIKFIRNIGHHRFIIEQFYQRWKITIRWIHSEREKEKEETW